MHNTKPTLNDWSLLYSVAHFGGRAACRMKIALGWLAILVSMLSSSPSHASDRQHCWGDFVLKSYAWTNLAELQAAGAIGYNNTSCTLNGRTGFVSLSYDYLNHGDLTVYTWICNDDGSGCGIDREDSGVFCSADVQSRDTSLGTELDDNIGIRGFQTRFNLTYGQMVGEIPVDENNQQVEDVFLLRVHCRYDP